MTSYQIVRTIQQLGEESPNEDSDADANDSIDINKTVEKMIRN